MKRIWGIACSVLFFWIVSEFAYAGQTAEIGSIVFDSITVNGSITATGQNTTITFGTVTVQGNLVVKGTATYSGNVGFNAPIDTITINAQTIPGYLTVRGTTTHNSAVTYNSGSTSAAVPQSRIVVRNASGAATGIGAFMVWASSYQAIADTNVYTAGLDVTTTTTRNAVGAAGITAESIPSASTGVMITWGYIASILAEERGGGGFDANTGALSGGDIISSTRAYYSGTARGSVGTVFYATNTVHAVGIWLSEMQAVTSGTAGGFVNFKR